MSSETSRLVLEIDSKGVVTANGNLDLFKKKSEDAAAAAKKAGDQTKKSFGDDVTSSMFGSMTAAGLAAQGIQKAATAMTDFISSSLKASGQLEMIRANLTTVMGSAELASATFEDLKKFAAATPFEMPGITESAIMLKQSGVAAGDLISTLTMLGDAAGGSQEKLNRIALNYAQIQSVGKASTMDIKQFAMAGLPIYDALADALKVSNEELGSMISNGKVTKDVVVQAFKDMTGEGGAFFNGMARGAVTLDGKISTLNDTWKTFQASLVDTTGFSAATKGMVDFLTGTLSGMTGNFDFLTANNAVNSGSASDAQTKMVGEARVEAIRARYAEIQRIIGVLNQSEGNGDMIAMYNDDINELLNNLAYWENKLGAISAKEKYLADLEAQRKAGVEGTEAAMKAYLLTQEDAAAAAAKWQKVLKDALDLDEVTTGAKAVSDYFSDMEAELNGALAYAQAFGGDIQTIYLEQAKKIKAAIKTLLQSGYWKPDEATITDLMGKAELYNAIGGGLSSPTPDFANTASMTGSKYASGGLTKEKTDEQKAQVDRLKEIYKDLGDSLKQFMADATFDALWDMGEALYAGEDAAKAFGESLFRSILNNVPAMLFQAGFQMAISGNLYGGLALMAVSGLAGVAGGYLTSMMDDTSEEGQSEADKLQNIADQLSDLITQAKDEATYYQNTLRTLNSQYANQSISSQSVNDAIIAPGGKIITTAPDDYLYAAKDPSKFGGGGGNVSISVINNAGDVASASATSKQNADGTTQILVMMEKVINSGLASGKFDQGLEARQARISGRRISV